MHELSIAQNILEIVQQSVPEAEASAVRYVRVRVGQLSGVVPESLDFCFSALVSDTNWQRATLDFEQTPATFRCKECSHHYQDEDMTFICPICKSKNIELTSGKELELVEIELIDKHDEAL